MVNYNKFNKNVLFICLSLMGGVSYAADSDDPIRQRIQADQTIRQQQRDTALEKQIQPNVSVNLGQEQNKISAQQLQYLHSNSETPCFEIKKILLEGDLAHQFISSFNVVTT
ncbi:putative hemolysin activator domain protein, partial [Acinetobacter baumannii 1598530]